LWITSGVGVPRAIGALCAGASGRGRRRGLSLSCSYRLRNLQVIYNLLNTFDGRGVAGRGIPLGHVIYIAREGHDSARCRDSYLLVSQSGVGIDPLLDFGDLVVVRLTAADSKYQNNELRLSLSSGAPSLKGRMLPIRMHSATVTIDSQLRSATALNCCSDARAIRLQVAEASDLRWST